MTIPLVDPVEKIQIYQEFNIDENLLHGAYVALTIRPEPLDMDEGNKLGLSTSLKIAQARELARASSGAADIFGPAAARLEESEVQSLIKDVFRLQEPASASTTLPPLPQPTPAGKNPSYPTNDDLAEKEKAAGKGRKNSALRTTVPSVITQSKLRSQTKRSLERSSHPSIGLGALSPTLCLLIFIICYLH